MTSGNSAEKYIMHNDTTASGLVNNEEEGEERISRSSEAVQRDAWSLHGDDYDPGIVGTDDEKRRGVRVSDTESWSLSASHSMYSSGSSGDGRSDAIIRRKGQEKRYMVKSLVQRLQEARLKKSLRGLDEDDRLELISQIKEIHGRSMDSTSLQTTMMSILPFEFSLPRDIMHQYQKSVQSISVLLVRLVAIVSAVIFPAVTAVSHILDMFEEGHMFINAGYIVRHALSAGLILFMLALFMISFTPNALKSPMRIHVWYFVIMFVMLVYMLADKSFSGTDDKAHFVIFIIIQSSAFFRILPFWAIFSWYLVVIGTNVAIDLVLMEKDHFMILRMFFSLSFTSLFSLVVWYLLSVRDRRSFLGRFATELYNEETECERLRNSQLLLNIFPQRIIERVARLMTALSQSDISTQSLKENQTKALDTLPHQEVQLISATPRDGGIALKKKEKKEVPKPNLPRKDTLGFLRHDMVCDSYENVTIMFVNVVDFSRRCSFLAASQIVDLLNEIFTEFDLLIEEKGMYRVKTIGSSYMCLAGLNAESPKEQEESLYVAVDTALMMLEISADQDFGVPLIDKPLEIAIGLNHGPAVAGVIGTKTLAYDIWSNSVNVAARLSTMADPGTIALTKDVYHLLVRQEKSLTTLPYKVLDRKGRVCNVKGRGMMHIFFLRSGMVESDVESCRESVVLRGSAPSSANPKMMLHVPDFLRQFVSEREKSKLRRAERIYDIQSINLADISKRLYSRERENFFDTLWITEQLSTIKSAMSLLNRKKNVTDLVNDWKTRISSHTRNKVAADGASMAEDTHAVYDDDGEAQAQISLEAVIRGVVDREFVGSELIPDRFIHRRDKIKTFEFFNPLLVRLRDKELHKQCVLTDMHARWKNQARLVLLFSFLSYLFQTMSDLLYLFGNRNAAPYDVDSGQWHWQLLWTLVVRLAIGAPILLCVLLFILTRYFARHPVVFNLTQFIFFLLLLVMTCAIQMIVPLNTDTSSYGFVVQIMLMFSVPGWPFWMKLIVSLLALLAMVIMHSFGVAYVFSFLTVIAVLIVNSYSGYLSTLEEQEDYFYRMLNRRKQEMLIDEQRRVQELMNHVLPTAITQQLHTGEITMTNGVLAQHYELAGVLFADLVSFTSISSALSPMKLVALLSDIFTSFDNIADKYRIEKIKLIGDCYNAASGIPIARKNHVLHLVLMGLEMVEYLDIRNKTLQDGESPAQFRIGISCGSVVGGVVGVTRFAFDLFGQLVDETNHIEQCGLPMQVHVSEQVFEHIQNVDQKLVEFHLREDSINNFRNTHTIQTYWARRYSATEDKRDKSVKSENYEDVS